MLTIEGADSANGHIHSDQDVMARHRPELMQILRMNLAASAGGWSRPQPRLGRPGPWLASAPGPPGRVRRRQRLGRRHKASDGNAWQPSVTDYEPLGGTVVDP